jgi:hypothetical protein
MTTDPRTILDQLAEQAAHRADVIGCSHSTQGGGMPDPAIVLADIATMARLPHGDVHRVFREVAALALFGAMLTKPR